MFAGKSATRKYTVTCTSLRPIVRDSVVVRATDVDAAMASAQEKLAHRYKSEPRFFVVQHAEALA